MTFNESFELPRPDRFTAGTVGEPGQRIFFLQALEAGRLVTLKCEKQQVGALAEHLAAMLVDLPIPGEDEIIRTDVDFEEPSMASWAVGRMGVAWDEDDDRLVLQCEEIVEAEADEPEEQEVELEDPPAFARFRLTRAQVAAFVEVARSLVQAGRPPCYLCGGPIDPTGHVCPRLN